MLVPQHLREHAGLDREVTIAGVGPRIEIWDKARFDEDLNKTQARFNEIASTVAGLARKES
jgi:MraZ protein